MTAEIARSGDVGQRGDYAASRWGAEMLTVLFVLYCDPVGFCLDRPTGREFLSHHECVEYIDRHYDLKGLHAVCRPAEWYRHD